MTTSDYLEQLQQDRQDLVDNLETKGITGLTGDETFTELVPEVLNIPSGGDTDIFFETEPETISTTSNWARYNYIKGEGITNATLTLPNNLTSVEGLFYGWAYETPPKVICSNSLTNLSALYRYDATVSTSFTMKHIDLSGLDTSNVTTMQNMFNGLKGLLELDMSTFVIKDGLNVGNLFKNCISLSHIDMRSFDFSKLGGFAQLFGADASTGVPDNCEIIVADQTQKDWINTNFSRLTNVKTVAEYEASLNS